LLGLFKGDREEHGFGFGLRGVCSDVHGEAKASEVGVELDCCLMLFLSGLEAEKAIIYV
jgi:hypothetical protein